MRKLYADEKRRTSEVTVRALMNADVERVAAAGPGRVDEVSVPVEVDLYWMKPVLAAVTKISSHRRAGHRPRELARARDVLLSHRRVARGDEE